MSNIVAWQQVKKVAGGDKMAEYYCPNVCGHHNSKISPCPFEKAILTGSLEVTTKPEDAKFIEYCPHFLSGRIVKFGDR